MKNKNTTFTADSFIRESVEFFIIIFKLFFTGLKNYWKYVLVVFLFFGLLYFFKSRKTESYYKAKASFVHNFAFKKIYGDQFFFLEKLAQEKQTTILSQALQLPEKTVKGILTIQAKNYVNSPLHEDLTYNRTPFYVYLECQNKEDIPLIQDALVSYIARDTAKNSIIQKEITNLQSALAVAKKDIANIDSLVLLQDRLGKNYSLELMNLSKVREKEKGELEFRLGDLNAVTLIQSFQSTPITKGKQLKKMQKKYALMAAVLSLIFVIFFQWYHNPGHEV